MLKPDTTLELFRRELNSTYGDRVQRVVLFGSRARGDARADSDYDIAVFLNDMPDRWEEMDRLALIGHRVMRSTQSVINALPFTPGSYDERTPLMHDIREEGRDL